MVRESTLPDESETQGFAINYMGSRDPTGVTGSHTLYGPDLHLPEKAVWETLVF